MGQVSYNSPASGGYRLDVSGGDPYDLGGGSPYGMGGLGWLETLARRSAENKLKQARLATKGMEMDLSSRVGGWGGTADQGKPTAFDRRVHTEQGLAAIDAAKNARNPVRSVMGVKEYLDDMNAKNPAFAHGQALLGTNADYFNLSPATALATGKDPFTSGWDKYAQLAGNINPSAQADYNLATSPSARAGLPGPRGIDPAMYPGREEDDEDEQGRRRKKGGSY